MTNWFNVIYNYLSSLPAHSIHKDTNTGVIFNSLDRRFTANMESEFKSNVYQLFCVHAEQRIGAASG